ncbi:MAG: type II toxin-antitoxin system VapC family toxin [Gallionella sp.]
MMTVDYLFDTNILIYLLDNRLAEKLPSGRYGYTDITEIELLSFSALTAEDIEIINSYLSNITLVNLTKAIKQKTVSLRRTYRIKLPDAIIVASAIEAGATLLTNDVALHKIENLSWRFLQINDLP